MSRDELVSFARKVRENLDLAGAFADWLEENGDKRGVLLRRRWKRWVKEREEGRRADEWAERQLREPSEKALALIRQLGGSGSVRVESPPLWQTAADNRFRHYFIGKFPESSPPLHESA